MSSQASSPSASYDQSTDKLAGDASSSSESHSDSFVPSQDSPKLDTENLGQNAELERHPKGKRKRTAAKDKAVLEAAYAANPKPDKAARLDIVKRVSLNEKEVQIWFQNRRQNDRRKSRPLTPQEIAALRYGGMQILSDPLSYNTIETTRSSSASPVQAPSFQDDTPVATELSTVDTELPMGVEKKGGQRTGSDAEEGSQHARAGSLQLELPSETQQVEPSKTSHRLSQSFSGTVGYLANRWNPGSSFSTPSSFSQRADDSFSLEPFAPSSCPATTSSAPLLPPPQSSQVRLRLSLEGKAEVVSSLPSPDRIAPSRPSSTLSDEMPHLSRPSLQRSHSAQPTVTLPPISTLTASLHAQAQPPATTFFPPRLHRGRSRDVNAWKLCCDADSVHRDDELTAQAESESSGSAIAAISLLRSTSGTGSSNVLQPNGAKRNASTHRHSRSNIVHQAKKPKLGRTSSSVARLQTSFTHTSLQRPVSRHPDIASEKDVDEKSGKATFVTSGGNDSDKENWSPDEDGNPQLRNVPRVIGSRRPLPSSAPKLHHNPRRIMGRALEEHRGAAFLGGSRANTAPSRSRRKDSGVAIYEDSGNSPAAAGVADDEVERFMRGEVSPSKKGDMDCVAGLLSLSQGNWR
ncbi:GS homeobox 2 [Pleurostoma richardsiae]|uniref:GS homeobox 2 n=1 Tax=Pleurostoma richardsiae TaxID=41990 RepID=A0AA38W136_9PEZI|nr:GS homeobox 2 [Pleurostoma richardsiae]